MASDRLIRLVHLPLFGFLLLVALITMAISASVVAKWNMDGAPNTTIRDRARISLAASLLAIFTCFYLGLGTFFAAGSVAFGILAHIVLLGLSFLFLLASAAAVTQYMRGVDCGMVTWARCNVMVGVEAMDWITTIICFITLLFVLFLAFKGRDVGFRRGTLADA